MQKIDITSIRLTPYPIENLCMIADVQDGLPSEPMFGDIIISGGLVFRVYASMSTNSDAGQTRHHLILGHLNYGMLKVHT